MSDQFQFDAFLSHNSQEKDAVKVVADRLRRLDSPIKVWLDEWELIPGRSSVEGIEDGIKQSLTFVLFLGPAGLGPWHQIERRAALFHERDSRGLVTIIPVLLPGIEQPKESVPLLLRDPTWVVFKSINPLDEEALHLLVCGIRGEKPGKFQHRMSNEIIDSNQQIVPRGLRSFTDRDSSYFLRLLPGPREKGLPLSISFWKEKLEEVDPDKTFRIGLLHGPSGCGKSSLVKAGLLPRLAEYVHAIYLEATPDDTESQLLAKLRKQFPELPVDLDLPATLQTLRENPQLASGSKVALILDQFEQWLHAKRIDDSTPLVQALRYCDGRVLQAVVMVRVDYHLETYRFFKQFDGVKIQDGINTQLVDLFDRNHASKVLLEFGRAYDRIADPGKLTAEEPSFLTEVLDQLQDKDQRLIAVQLALFADLMKDKPWTGEILKKLGGATGVGRAYLEEKFDSKMANPTHKRHRKAAIAILKELLPPRGAEIKGTSRTRSQLIAATEYTARLQDFDELIQILQNDLKLIAPAALDEDATEERPEPSFQLIHDYLVPSLRDWLTATDRESWSGRARILIEERTADWLRDNENPRHSLTPWQWLSIQCGVSKRKRSEDANRLLRRSIRRFSTQTAIVVSVLLGPVVAYFGSEFFTFQASFDSREYDGQRREIIITKRFDPRPAAWQFRQGTWIFKDDLKDRESEDKVNNLILNSGLSPDWSPLVPLLNYSRLSIAELEWLDRPISAQAAYLDSKDLAVWNRIEPDPMRWQIGRTDRAAAVG